jgi:hypothetical protein
MKNATISQCIVTKKHSLQTCHAAVRTLESKPIPFDCLELFEFLLGRLSIATRGLHTITRKNGGLLLDFGHERAVLRIRILIVDSLRSRSEIFSLLLYPRLLRYNPR